MITKKLFIDGAWVDGSEGKTFKSINPATGEVIAEIGKHRLRMRAEQSRLRRNPFMRQESGAIWIHRRAEICF